MWPILKTDNKRRRFVFVTKILIMYLSCHESSCPQKYIKIYEIIVLHIFDKMMVLARDFVTGKVSLNILQILKGFCSTEMVFTGKK